MRIIKSIPGQSIYFQESVSEKGNISQGRERGIINIYDEIKYQPILGIGGAFTESSAYNYSLLTPAQKKDFMEKHFRHFRAERAQGHPALGKLRLHRRAGSRIHREIPGAHFGCRGSFPY